MWKRKYRGMGVSEICRLTLFIGGEPKVEATGGISRIQRKSYFLGRLMMLQVIEVELMNWYQWQQKKDLIFLKSQSSIMLKKKG